MTDQRLNRTVIPPGVYGQAEAAIITVIEIAESLRWFATPHNGAHLHLERLLSQHFAALRRETPSLAWRTCSTRLVTGTLTDGSDLYFQVAAGDGAAPFARGLWRSALGQVAAKVQEDLEQPYFRPFIEPPLFPLPGKPGFLAGTLAARRDILGQLPVAESHRKVIWSWMCDVDMDFWNAIQWQLAGRGALDENPFFKLIELYRLGFYPIGVRSEHFVVYAHS